MRLSQSGLRFFVEVFEGTSRLERTPVKPSDSRDALLEKMDSRARSALLRPSTHHLGCEVRL